MDIYQEALEFHQKLKGKLSIELKAPLNDKHDLSLAYTPGVAKPCLEIAKDKDLAYQYTGKGNTVAVISDGSAVLGLGNIGAIAGLPVMEGKSVLFKRFAGIDSTPLVIDVHDSQGIIDFCKVVAPSFGGINLEDIAAPKCVEIERKLIEELDIPVFHDDQHGTAIVLTAALINSLKLVNKKLEDITVVVSGTGAAGSSIIKMIHSLNVKEIYGFNINGILIKEDSDSYDFLSKELVEITNHANKRLTLAQALKEADVFIGVSAPNLLDKEMVKSMKDKAIVFPMANPEPEIKYQDAIEAGAYIVGTGRSDYPNQINNVLAFPGLFKGALAVKARKINEEMKMAAALALANLIKENELRPDYIIPSSFDERVANTISEAVAKMAIETGVARI